MIVSMSLEVQRFNINSSLAGLVQSLTSNLRAKVVKPESAEDFSHNARLALHQAITTPVASAMKGILQLTGVEATKNHPLGDFFLTPFNLAAIVNHKREEPRKKDVSDALLLYLLGASNSAIKLIEAFFATNIARDNQINNNRAFEGTTTDGVKLGMSVAGPQDLRQANYTYQTESGLHIKETSINGYPIELALRALGRLGGEKKMRLQYPIDTMRRLLDNTIDMGGPVSIEATSVDLVKPSQEKPPTTPKPNNETTAKEAAQKSATTEVPLAEPVRGYYREDLL